MATYDNYQYRLSSTTPPFDVILPKDLFWNNELLWSPVSQSYEWSTTGALLIQEGVKLKGREIDIVGKDNMAWVTRTTCLTLQQMRDTAGLKMNFSFFDTANPGTSLFNYTVQFRHADGAFDAAPVLDYDQYGTSRVEYVPVIPPNPDDPITYDRVEIADDSWYIIRSIKLIEVLA